jgi:membrane-associated protease RseP (regulator of RpoE activity)
MSDIPTISELSSEEIKRFEEVRNIVISEFEVEDAFIGYSVPTFYVKYKENSKNAFLRLVKKLGTFGYTPILRRHEGKVILRVLPKPKTKPSRPIINIVLLIATLGTTLLAGYILPTMYETNFVIVSKPWIELSTVSNPWINAAIFGLAIMVVLGVHEMGHKIAANKNNVEATMPYFIPGPPPPYGLGTFGAVIVQRELPPNKDALFDVGSAGPFLGFFASLIFTVIGLLLSPIGASSQQMLSEGYSPIIIQLLARALVKAPTLYDPNLYYYVVFHPLATVGLIGMFVTMLNLFPTGMLDGGHIARSIVGEKVMVVLNVFSIFLMFIFRYWFMLFFVLFFSLYRHPGPLDDVSELSTSRKLLAIALVIIFLLCLLPDWVIYFFD